MERCPNCGASIRAGARFCTACGYRLIQPDAPTPTPSAAPVASQTVKSSTTADPNGGNGVGQAPATGTGTGESPAATSNEADGQTYEASTTYADDFPASADSDDPTSEPAATDSGEPTLAGNPSESSSEPSAGSSSVGSWDAEHGLADEPAGMTSAADDERSRSENTDDTAQTEVDSDDPINSVATAEREPTVSGEAEAEPTRATEAAPHPRDGATGTEIELSAVPLPAATDDGVWTPSESATTTSETGAVADDVVIESTVVGESSWPEAESADSTGTKADATARSSEPDALSFPDLIESPIAADEIGTDVDWEPWRDGGAEQADGSAGSINQPSYQPTGIGSNASSSGATADGVERARQLLEELRETLDTLPTTAEPAADPDATVAAGMVQQVEQLLDTWSGAGIDSERLEDLQRLAEDLEGRDYDIRALQRFSQERDLILELARGFQQQQDLIGQIQGVLNRAD